MKTLLLCILGFPIFLSAQKPPLTLVLAYAGVRTLDAYSTERMISQGNHELVLPDFITHHPVAMYSFSEGMVGFNYLLARHLMRKGHRRLGKLVMLIDMGQDAPAAVRNLFLSRKKIRISLHLPIK